MSGSPDNQKSESVHRANHPTGTKRKCSVEGCEDEYRAKGYCARHYHQIWKYGEIKNIHKAIRGNSICSVEGCGRPSCRRNLCNKHSQHEVYKQTTIHQRTKKDLNEYWFDDNICYMQIYNNTCDPIFVVTIDKEDYEKVKDYKWGIQDHNTMTIKNKKMGYLSRFIANITDPKMKVDHKNHDRLDNRKENLRPCTNSQNLANQSIRSDNTSGYKGVYLDSTNKKWTAKITINGKRIFLGSYYDKHHAAARYNREAKRLFGEFALPNIIMENAQ